MTQETEIRELLDRWDQVWAGRDDLLLGCLAPVYVRHGSSFQSPFTVSYTPDEYGRVVADQRDRFKLRVTIPDRVIVGDRVWIRYTLYRTDPETGKRTTRAALQSYRVEAGKLAETWVALHGDDSAWPDTVDPT